MTYQIKDYNRLLGMEGFSDILLKNHFTLYQGYVTNSNKVLDALNQMLISRISAGTQWRKGFYSTEDESLKFSNL